MAFWHENCGVGPELYMKNATKQSRCPRPGLLAGTKHKTAEARNITVVPRNIPVIATHIMAPALVLPHAAAGSTAAACARAGTRSHVATHHHCQHNTAHAHTPAIASSTQEWSSSCSLHRTGVAKITAHAQRRCRHSTPQPCGTHATFFLVLDLCPLSLFGRHFFLLLLLLFAARLATPARAHAFRGASCHTSTHARAARARTTPSDERYDVRSAGVADWKTAARGNTERTLTA